MEQPSSWASSVTLAKENITANCTLALEAFNSMWFSVSVTYISLANSSHMTMLPFKEWGSRVLLFQEGELIRMNRNTPKAPLGSALFAMLGWFPSYQNIGVYVYKKLGITFFSLEKQSCFPTLPWREKLGQTHFISTYKAISRHAILFMHQKCMWWWGW